MFKHGFCIIVFVSFVSQIWNVYGDIQEDSWVEPHAWGHLDDWNDEKAADACKLCKPPVEGASTCHTDETASLIYFKKFVTMLFNKNHFQYDENAKLHKRTLLFQLLPAQLDALEHTRDPRDLDIILTKIFENVRPPPIRACNDGSGKSMSALVWEIIKDFMQLLKISEIQFIVFVILAIMIGWFVHRRYRIRPLIVVFGGIFLFGYFVTYFECNRKLESDQLIEMIDSYAENTNVNNLPWYSRVKNYVFSIDPVVVAQKAKIRKSNKVNLAFCRPDHVLMMYGNEMFVKQVEFMIEKCTSTFSTLKNGLPFPYNFLAPVALLFLVAYILKLTFKYILSPKAWAALLHVPSFNKNQSQPVQQPAIIALDPTTDRVSGENLKMLLNVIHTSATVSQATRQQFPLVSGVQEVLEMVEAPPDENSSPDTTDSSISETKSASRTENNNDADAGASNLEKTTLDTEVTDK